jgi:hypothetical protein
MTSPIVAMKMRKMRRWVAFNEFLRTDAVADVYRIEPWEPDRLHSSVWGLSRKL